MHSGHRESSSVAPLVLPLLRPCQCLSCRIRQINAVCPTDDFAGISSRAASSMVLSVHCLPLMLSPSLSARCWLCLCLCILIMSPFKAVGFPFFSPQYHSPGISSPLIINCRETVRTSGRIPPSAISSRSPSGSLSARLLAHS